MSKCVPSLRKVVFRIFACTATLLLTAAPGLAESVQLNQIQRHNFKIAPQPLSDALKQLALQSGVQVSVRSELLEGLSSQGLTGQMSIRQAIEAILNGSKLLYEMNGNSISILSVTKKDSEFVLKPLEIVGKLEPYFEKINSTALKGTADQKYIPYTTNVLSSQVIEDRKAKKLDKVFTYIPGFAQSTDIANGFTIRGQTAELQNIQVDGLPGLSNRFGAPTTANIEKVEVIKGPASVLYGWMDPSGMVNLITKKPEKEQAAQLNLSAQTFPEYGASGGGRLN